MQVKHSIPLAAGVLASVGASVCCVLPLALVSVGLGGAWLSVLNGFAPYRPIFIAVALGALGFAYWQLFVRTEPACEPDRACAGAGVQRRRKTVFWVVTAAVGALLAFPYVFPLFY